LLFSIKQGDEKMGNKMLLAMILMHVQDWNFSPLMEIFGTAVFFIMAFMLDKFQEKCFK